MWHPVILILFLASGKSLLIEDLAADGYLLPACETRAANMALDLPSFLAENKLEGEYVFRATCVEQPLAVKRKA